jgi:hypothetical protein
MIENQILINISNNHIKAKTRKNEKLINEIWNQKKEKIWRILMPGIKTDRHSKKGLPDDRGNADASPSRNKALRRVRERREQNQPTNQPTNERASETME